MDVEIVVDSKYSEPKVVIYTDNVSNDISNLVNQIKNSNIKLKNIFNFYIKSIFCKDSTISSTSSSDIFTIMWS